jgi:hypothetical protein
MASMLPDANPCCDQCSGLTVTIVSTVGMLAGHGDPEGVVTATLQGQVYTDLDTGTLYKFVGTAGTAVGWV